MTQNEKYGIMVLGGHRKVVEKTITDGFYSVCRNGKWIGDPHIVAKKIGGNVMSVTLEKSIDLILHGVPKEIML